MAEGRGERTIGSGHLVALFLGIVVLCCVFFILGYEMGRAQFEKGGAAAAAKPATSTPAPAASTSASATPGAPAWPSGSSPTPSTTPATTAAKPASSAPAPGSPVAAATKPAHPASGKGIDPSLRAPEIPAGSIVLQVAANRSESDALGLAKLLQDKGYPAFVLTPAGDDWYRVQVGPFADAKSADQAKTGLAKEGFKAIIKH
jgi:DedD protein